MARLHLRGGGLTLLCSAPTHRSPGKIISPTPSSSLRIRGFVAHAGLAGAAPEPGGPAAPDAAVQTWRLGGLSVSFTPRAPGTPPAATSTVLITGDDGEFDAMQPDASLVGGTPLRYDEASRSLVIATSIVALPPVFLYRGPGGVAVASDIASLHGLPGVRLELDAQGVSELGRFGHPVGHRTLFRNVELVPGGGVLTVSADGQAQFRRTWQMPHKHALSWPEFIEAQIAAFTDGVRRMDLSSAFLSLTAGLDTRTVFATLASQNRLLTSATMTGQRRSLDARIAAALCGAYGVRHQALVFDDRFLRELPRYVETASRLTGGIESLNQAPEVYMYDLLGGAFASRLSGNLGNQVGRGGTEGVSVRGADLGILDARLHSAAAPGSHWLLEQLDQGAQSTLTFILQNEIALTLVGNYTLGSTFAVQQSPYANRALIETLAARPQDRAVSPSGSKLRMRLRDLKHRFLGEDEGHSFQRTLVRRIGGFAAECPVNWGWRPRGGVSLPGLVMGSATFAGMAARSTGLDAGLSWTGLPALHDFRESRRWLRLHLRDFTHDTLRAAAVREAGLFDVPRLEAVLAEHFEGRRDHYQTVTYALDVALAHRHLAG